MAHSRNKEKLCPRCGDNFECKPGDIANCECNFISLAAKATELLHNKYGDCLCKNCLLQLAGRDQTELIILAQD